MINKCFQFGDYASELAADFISGSGLGAFCEFLIRVHLVPGLWVKGSVLTHQTSSLDFFVTMPLKVLSFLLYAHSHTYSYGLSAGCANVYPSKV